MLSGRRGPGVRTSPRSGARRLVCIPPPWLQLLPTPCRWLRDDVSPRWKWPFLNCFECFAGQETCKSRACLPHRSSSRLCHLPGAQTSAQPWGAEPSVRPLWRVEAVARAGRPGAARRLKPRDGRQRRGWGGRAAGGDGPAAGTRGHDAPPQKAERQQMQRCFFSILQHTNYSLGAILSLHGDGCAHTRYFNSAALPSVHKRAQGAEVDSSVCHRRWIS